jgi:WD40 repeat protein
LVAGSVVAAAILTATAIVARNMAIVHEQTRATALLRSEQDRTQKALEQAEKYRHTAERLSAIAALDRGLQACDQGDPARGLLWLARSLPLVPSSDTDLERVVRMNIAAWVDRLPYLLERIHSHEGWVHCVAFSPDGKTLASGGVDRTLRLWSVATGKPLCAPLPHEGLVYQVAFHPDGALLATACDDGHVRLWNARDGHLVSDKAKHDDMVYSIAFSPDGAQLASGGRDQMLRVWDLATGKPHVDPIDVGAWVMTVAYHADGGSIVTGDANHKVRVWDASTGRSVGNARSGWGALPLSIPSPDGQTLAVGVTENHAYLIDLSTWKTRARLEHRGSLNALSFTRDGSMLLTASADGKVRAWNAKTGRLNRLPVQHASSVYAVAANPDGSKIATGTSSGLARIWRYHDDSSEFVLPLVNSNHIYSTSMSRDGRRLLVASMYGPVTLWDVAGRSLVGSTHLDGELHAVDLSPDGNLFLVARDNRIQVFDSVSMEPITEPGHDQAKILAAKFTPDGQRILTGSQARHVRFWHAKTCQPASEPVPHPHWIHAVDISPDGRFFLTGCEDCYVRQWSMETYEQIGPALAHQGPVRGVAYSPRGSMALTGSWGDGLARLWDLNSGSVKLTFFNNRGHIHDVAFGPDGRNVATAHWDMASQLWDAATGKPLGPPVQFTEAAKTLSFSSDGKTLVTGSYNGQVKLTAVPVPQSGTAEQINAWISLLTGLELTSDGAVVPLSEADFIQRQRDLDETGFQRLAAHVH